MELLLKYFPELTEQKIATFQEYKDLFIDWNGKINLVSRKDTEHFIENHILHSLAIAKYISFSKETKILDIGTGGGLPGLPLAIMFPEVNFLLVDSIGKKIMVVNDLIQKLNLTNITAVQDRAENIQGDFDFIVSRAVAPLSKLDSWVTGKLKKKSFNSIQNGYIFLKGGDLSEEISNSKLKTNQIMLSDYFEEPFFETKKIIYVPKM